jgi:hypothetical protein
MSGSMSAGMVILFQRRTFPGSLADLVKSLPKKIEISDAGEGQLLLRGFGASIRLAFRDAPKLLEQVRDKAIEYGAERFAAEIDRCDRILVASWNDVDEVADLSLEVCYLEQDLQGITQFLNTGEMSDASWAAGAGAAALDAAGKPITGGALAARLVGSWVDIDDPTSSVTFTRSKDLVYSRQAGGGVQRILLTYAVDGAELASDQPSNPSETRTPISFGEDGTLYLRDNGVNRWRREDPAAISDPDAALLALVGFVSRHAISSTTPGGAMDPFLVIEEAGGERSLVRILAARPDAARSSAIETLAKLTTATLCAYAVDARVTAEDGSSSDAIVIEASRRGRAGTIVMTQTYANAAATGPLSPQPDGTPSWLS